MTRWESTCVALVISAICSPRLYAFADDVGKFSRFTPYKPIYFIFSSRPTSPIRTIKFQLSYQYQPYRYVNKLPEKSWQKISKKEKFKRTSGLFFNSIRIAYTQKAFWPISEESSPFEEFNHNPEIVSLWNFDHHRMKWLRFGIWEHESNGEAGDDSRGWDRAYAQTEVYLDSSGVWKSFLNIKGWWVLRKAAENDSITDFQGHWEIRGGLIKRPTSGLAPDLPYKAEAAITIRRFAAWNRDAAGSIQVDLKYVPSWLSEPILYLQVWRGYGESLVYYGERKSVKGRGGWREGKAKWGLQLKF